MPNVALSVSRFMSSALIGSTTEPVIRKRIVNVVTASRPSASGRLSARLDCWSVKRAADPVDRDRHGRGHVADGAQDVPVRRRQRVARRQHVDLDGVGVQALRRRDTGRRRGSPRGAAA